MDFADEPYVRKYPRKTVTNRLLGWEGRAVLDAMLGEFDAAGIFAIRGDAARCITAVTEIPIEIVQVGLARLIETETWLVTERVITWPTYEEAQNCTRSDRQRQRESRRARAAKSVTNVTTGHAAPQPVTNVTDCHSPSHPPSAPSHPSTPPVHPDPERARAELPKVPGLVRVAGAGGVSKVYEMPDIDPPQTFIEEAIASAVSRAQAVSTWNHYRTAGLPVTGVDRLFGWLIQRALEKQVRDARAPSARGDPPGEPLAGWQPTTLRDFCNKHGIDFGHEENRYRRSAAFKACRTHAEADEGWKQHVRSCAPGRTKEQRA